MNGLSYSLYRTFCSSQICSSLDQLLAHRTDGGVHRMECPHRITDVFVATLDSSL